MFFFNAGRLIVIRVFLFKAGKLAVICNRFAVIRHSLRRDIPGRGLFRQLFGYVLLRFLRLLRLSVRVVFRREIVFLAGELQFDFLAAAAGDFQAGQLAVFAVEPLQLNVLLIL